MPIIYGRLGFSSRWVSTYFLEWLSPGRRASTPGRGHTRPEALRRVPLLQETLMDLLLGAHEREQRCLLLQKLSLPSFRSFQLPL
jgi:hypothetical protein